MITIKYGNLIQDSLIRFFLPNVTLITLSTIVAIKVSFNLDIQVLFIIQSVHMYILTLFMSFWYIILGHYFGMILWYFVEISSAAVSEQLLIMYTFLNQMKIGKNIQHKDDRMNSLYVRSQIGIFPIWLTRFNNQSQSYKSKIE